MYTALDGLARGRGGGAGAWLAAAFAEAGRGVVAAFAGPVGLGDAEGADVLVEGEPGGSADGPKLDPWLEPGESTAARGAVRPLWLVGGLGVAGAQPRSWPRNADVPRTRRTVDVRKLWGRRVRRVGSLIGSRPSPARSRRMLAVPGGSREDRNGTGDGRPSVRAATPRSGRRARRSG